MLILCKIQSRLGSFIYFNAAQGGKHNLKKIELIGPPGSGKTTLVKNIAGITDKDNNSIVSLNELYIRELTRRKRLFKTMPKKFVRRYHHHFIAKEYEEFMTACFTDYGKSMEEMIGFLTKMDKNDRYYTVKVLNEDMFKWYIVSRFGMQERAAVICDEHFTHRIGRIFKYSDEKDYENDLKRYFDLLGWPDTVIHLDISAQEAYERMKKRKQGLPLSYESKTKEEALVQLERSRRSSEYLRTHLEAAGVKTYRIESTSNNPDTVQKLKEELTEEFTAAPSLSV